MARSNTQATLSLPTLFPPIPPKSHDAVTIWQALTPASTLKIKSFGGAHLQPSAPGDQLLLLKPTYGQAVTAARTVWAPRFGSASVVEITLPAATLERYPRQCVAYQETEEIVIPAGDLSPLDQCLLRPIRVVERIILSTSEPQHRFAHAQRTLQAVESFC